MNPYAAPRSTPQRALVRLFPLMIRDRRSLWVDLDEPSLDTHLRLWALRHRFRLERRAAGNWVLRRANHWTALFAWDIRDVPTHLRCRWDPNEQRLDLRLVCQHDWAIATPGDPIRLARELDELESALTGTGVRSASA